MIDCELATDQDGLRNHRYRRCATSKLERIDISGCELAANAVTADSRGRQHMVHNGKRTGSRESGDRGLECDSAIAPRKLNVVTVSKLRHRSLSPLRGVRVFSAHRIPWADAHGYLLSPHSRLRKRVALLPFTPVFQLQLFLTQAKLTPSRCFKRRPTLQRIGRFPK